MQYIEECLGARGQAYKDAFSAACYSGSGAELTVEPTQSDSQVCRDAANSNSDVRMCVSSLESVCRCSCKSALEEYADECLGDNAQAYKDAQRSICESLDTEPTERPTAISSRDICRLILNSNSKVYRCLTDYAFNPVSICSSNCRSVLEQYADECLPCDDSQAFKDTLATDCTQQPDIDADDDTNANDGSRSSSSNNMDAKDGATVVGVTLLSVIPALLIAMAVALH